MQDEFPCHDRKMKNKNAGQTHEKIERDLKTTF